MKHLLKMEQPNSKKVSELSGGCKIERKTIKKLAKGSRSRLGSNRYSTEGKNVKQQTWKR